MRSHTCIDKPKPDKDPDYRYWEGWIDNKGNLTQKTGQVIVWENQDWQKLFSPESEDPAKK